MADRYELWNKALIDDYFPKGGRGSLAYLPVDDDELRAMAEAHQICDPDEAVEDFVGSVVAKLAQKNGSFTRFTAWVDGWRRVRATPSYVAGLALCVLAASRMDTDPGAGIAAHNYYSRLNDLLGRDPSAGQPAGFDRLPAAWNDLTRWLDVDCRGTRGRSTIHTHPKWKYVGYPLSQALLRASDRRRLPDFFRVAGVEPSTEVSAERLFVLLSAWSAHSSCGLTARGRAAIQDATDVDRDEIAETVLRELRSWDGELRDSRGRRRAPIHLLIHQRALGTSVRLIVPRKEGFPESGWVIERTSQSISLEEHIASDEWFAPLDLTINPSIMDSGLQLTSGNFALAIEPAVAIPCRQAPVEIGGYLSQAQAALWEPHLAVVNAGYRQHLLDFLDPYCDEQVAVHPSESDLPRGWEITKPFRISKVPVDPPKEFDRLAPRLVATTSLDGGLRLGASLYLTGGEPDAYIAADPDVGLEVELDGEPQVISGGVLRLELSRMELDPGPHHLKAEVVRTFSTTKSMDDVVPSIAGRLGHPFTRHGKLHPGSAEAVGIERPARRGEVTVSGAEVTGDPEALPLGDRRPYLLRAGARQYVLVGSSPSDVVVQAGGPPPAWLHYVGLSEAIQFVDVECTFAPAWALVEGSTGDLSARAMAPAPPEGETPVNPRWIESILKWKLTEVLGFEDEWASYVSMAEQLAAEVPCADR